MSFGPSMTSNRPSPAYALWRASRMLFQRASRTDECSRNVSASCHLENFTTQKNRVVLRPLHPFGQRICVVAAVFYAKEDYGADHQRHPAKVIKNK